MKILINIPEFKVENETLVINTNNDQKINIENFNSDEIKIYEKFIKLSENSDLLEIKNYKEDLFIHRMCDVQVTNQKYIDYEDLSSKDKKVIDDFVEMVKNK